MHMQVQGHVTDRHEYFSSSMIYFHFSFSISHVPHHSPSTAPTLTSSSFRFHRSVARIYPRLKQFERVCDAARIRFPVDHVISRKTQLSVQHVLTTFGPDFVARHHILGGGAREAGIQSGTTGGERLETRDTWHETRRGDADRRSTSSSPSDK